MKKIVFCCINYNNSEEVLEYAESISLQLNSKESLLLIIDNSTIQEEKNNLKNKVKNIDLKIQILDFQSNLGYLNGMFAGIQNYYNLYKGYPEWVIFSNTDIKFFDNKLIENLIQKEYPEDYWCIAPSIYSLQTKSYQNPHYKKRISLLKINRILFFSKYHILFNLYTILSSIKSQNRKKIEEKSQVIYAAHGSFFILKKDYFENLDKLEYGAFLYSEEAFIAETIRRRQKKIFYDNLLKIIHTEHSTTSLIGNKNRARFINDSLNYIKKKFYKMEDKK